MHCLVTADELLGIQAAVRPLHVEPLLTCIPLVDRNAPPSFSILKTATEIYEILRALSLFSHRSHADMWVSKIEWSLLQMWLMCTPRVASKQLHVLAEHLLTDTLFLYPRNVHSVWSTEASGLVNKGTVTGTGEGPLGAFESVNTTWAAPSGVIITTATVCCCDSMHAYNANVVPLVSHARVSTAIVGIDGPKGTIY